MVIIITNDTNTLNGALMELGSLMAENLTTQGLIGVSASDGLTTLANDILLIQGGGGSTTLFEDDCSSASGLTNYGTLHHLGNQTSGGTLSYDSTKNAYKFSPSNVADNGFCDIPIPSLDNQDKYNIEVEFFTDDSTTGGQTGLTLYSTSDTGGNGVFFRDIANINRCGVLKFTNYSENGESGNSQQSSLPVYNHWYKLRLEIDGTSVTAKWLQTDDTLVYSTNYTVPYTASQMRIGLTFLSKNSSKYYYIRNIKAVGQGSGSDCSQYQTQIENAIEYINGSGS